MNRILINTDEYDIQRAIISLKSDIIHDILRSKYNKYDVVTTCKITVNIDKLTIQHKQTTCKKCLQVQIETEIE